MEKLRLAVEAGASHEQIIAKMRAEGLSIVLSIGLLGRSYNLSHSQAKFTVHFSDTWADCLRTNRDFHDAALVAAKEAGCAVVEIEQDHEVVQGAR